MRVLIFLSMQLCGRSLSHSCHQCLPLPCPAPPLPRPVPRGPPPLYPWARIVGVQQSAPELLLGWVAMGEGDPRRGQGQRRDRRCCRSRGRGGSQGDDSGVPRGPRGSVQPCDQGGAAGTVMRFIVAKHSLLIAVPLPRVQMEPISRAHSRGAILRSLGLS